MTVVTSGSYNERYFFEVSGHAVSEDKKLPVGTEAEGTREDSLACAAVSILVLTAVEKIEEMQREGAFLNSSVTVEPGYAEFDLEVREDREDELGVIFDTLLLGFELLEENYPDCVSVR